MSPAHGANALRPADNRQGRQKTMDAGWERNDRQQWDANSKRPWFVFTRPNASRAGTLGDSYNECIALQVTMRHRGEERRE